MWLSIIYILYSFFNLGDALETTLEGTWVSKSNTVITGPGFYDPVDELLKEPSLPGISYSFDNDNNWEQALYRVTPNPRNHSCATASLVFQHGKYKIDKQGKLILKPYESDGRQLFSDPCNDEGKSKYTRYKQEEVMHSFVIEEDKYYKRLKLQLYEWDGKKKQPMWLTYRPPQMLPTYVLNPVSEKDKHSLRNWHQKIKRSLEDRSLTNTYRQPGTLENVIKISLLTAIIGLYVAVRSFKISKQPSSRVNVESVLPSVL